MISRRQALSLMAGSLVAACATRPELPPRRLILRHPASGDRLDVSYWCDGGYDPSALTRVDRFFRDRHDGEVHPIDPRLLDLLHDLRGTLGLSPGTPIDLLSGYRSPRTNARLARCSRNVAAHSYHLRGQAADIHLPHVSPVRVATVAGALHRGGYAAYPGDGFTHVDTGPVSDPAVYPETPRAIQPLLRLLCSATAMPRKILLPSEEAACRQWRLRRQATAPRSD